MSMRTIQVTGKGNLSVKPDMTRLTITLNNTYKEYEDTLRHSAEDTEGLKELLEGFGFEKADVKTLSFKVDTEYESYKEKGTYHQRLVGYSYTHVLKVEFESDNKRLGKILFALSRSPLNPEFRITYTVKDPEAAKNELLGRAVKDAMEKADVLAKSAGVHLGGIEKIDYSFKQVDFEVHPYGMVAENAVMAPSMAAESYDMDIEPDDIEASDNVTVIWEIQ